MSYLLTNCSRGKSGEQPNVRANVNYRTARLELYSVLQVALSLEYLDIEEKEVVPADICSFKTARKRCCLQRVRPAAFLLLAVWSMQAKHELELFGCLAGGLRCHPEKISFANCKYNAETINLRPKTLVSARFLSYSFCITSSSSALCYVHAVLALMKLESQLQRCYKPRMICRDSA